MQKKVDLMFPTFFLKKKRSAFFCMIPIYSSSLLLQFDESFSKGLPCNHLSNRTGAGEAREKGGRGEEEGGNWRKYTIVVWVESGLWWSFTLAGKIKHIKDGEGNLWTVTPRATNGLLTKIGVVWEKSDFLAKNRDFGPKKRVPLLYSNHVLATTGKSCSKKKRAFAQIIKGGNVILGDFLG